MSRLGNRHDLRGREPGQEFVGALDGRVTLATPQDESRDVDCRKGSGRRQEIICGSPIQNVDRRGFNGVIANTLRPAGESAGSAIEINHLFNRSLFAAMESTEIGVGHFAKCGIVPVLSHMPQDFRRGRLKDRKT